MPIAFEDGGTWVAMSVTGARAKAHNAGLHIDMRLIYAAVGYTNNIGHAEFGQGDLRKALETVKPQTGEIDTPTAVQVSKAIKRMTLAGELAEGSNAKCLILPAGMWQKDGPMEDAGHASGWCTWHGEGVAPARRADRVRLRAV